MGRLPHDHIHDDDVGRIDGQTVFSTCWGIMYNIAVMSLLAPAILYAGWRWSRRGDRDRRV